MLISIYIKIFWARTGNDKTPGNKRMGNGLATDGLMDGQRMGNGWVNGWATDGLMDGQRMG
jgi:hypothetical protein